MKSGCRNTLFRRLTVLFPVPRPLGSG